MSLHAQLAEAKLRALEGRVYGQEGNKYKCDEIRLELVEHGYVHVTLLMKGEAVVSFNTKKVYAHVDNVSNVSATANAYGVTYETIYTNQYFIITVEQTIKSGEVYDEVHLDVKTVMS